MTIASIPSYPVGEWMNCSHAKSPKKGCLTIPFREQIPPDIIVRLGSCTVLGLLLFGSAAIADNKVSISGFIPGRAWNPDKIGAFMNGQWYMDCNGNGTWEGQPPDRTTSFGIAGDIPVVGDWDRDTASEMGVFRGGQWYVDYGGRPDPWDGTTIDRPSNFGFTSAIPVIGDWNGDTEPEIGVYNAGTWYLDTNSNNTWDGTGTGKDAQHSFGAAGWTPVVGDWNRDGQVEIGAYTGAGTWYVDANRNYLWDGTGSGKDTILNFGFAGAIPVTGDWNQDGVFEIGVLNAGTWYLDANGDNAWDGTGPGKDVVYAFGASGFTPVVGDWT